MLIDCDPAVWTWTVDRDTVDRWMVSPLNSNKFKLF